MRIRTIVMVETMLLLAALFVGGCGKELCPPEIHPLMSYCAFHGMHYSAVYKQKGASGYWTIEVWEKGTHWWNDPASYQAGVTVPAWYATEVKLSDAVDGVLEHISKGAKGEYYLEPHKTLYECEK